MCCFDVYEILFCWHRKFVLFLHFSIETVKSVVYHLFFIIMFYFVSSALAFCWWYIISFVTFVVQCCISVRYVPYEASGHILHLYVIDTVPFINLAIAWYSKKYIVSCQVKFNSRFIIKNWNIHIEHALINLFQCTAGIRVWFSVLKKSWSDRRKYLY